MSTEPTPVQIGSRPKPERLAVTGIGNALLDVIMQDHDNVHAKLGLAKGGMTLVDLSEAHQIYGDIQVVYQGTEFCGHSAQATLTVTNPYITEKDVEKYAPPSAPSSLITLGQGNFAVFYPQDGHQPGVQIAAAAEILKVVIKFRL